MKLQRSLLQRIKLVICITLFFPMAAFAHLISISAISPFPPQVLASTATTATYAVTNITSKVPLTVVDQSQFPTGSGLSIASSTCGRPINPGQSCTLQLQLHAPSTPQIISTELREWASPSVDGVRYPIVINVQPIPRYVITPSAGVGGTISPNTPQVVNSGGSLNFTATPNSEFTVNQWRVDGVVVQTGGTTFTLSNITANHSVQVTFTTSIIGIPAIAVGQDFTGTNLALLAASSDGGDTWGIKALPGSPSGVFVAGSCTGDAAPICIAGGFDGGTGLGLLAVSTDGAITWELKSIPGLSATSVFAGASCTGSGATAICAVGGRGPDIGAGPPLVAVSTNGANTWTIKSIPGLPASGFFISASCIGTGVTAICSMAGVDSSNLSDAPLLAVSTDGANTWALKTVVGLPTIGRFDGTSCTGSGGSAICTAAGTDQSSGSPVPLLAASTDGGDNWAVQTIAGVPILGSFTSTSCTGSGATAICIAVGADQTDNTPLLVVSTDGATTWAVTPIPGITINGDFNAASCTGTGATAICVAVGQDGVGTQPPLLAASTDGGVTWSVKTIAGLPTFGVFNSVTCTGSGATAMCVAAGEDHGGISPPAPFLAVSTDGANTWSVKIIPGNPTSGVFYGTGATSTATRLSQNFITTSTHILRHEH